MCIAIFGMCMHCYQRECHQARKQRQTIKQQAYMTYQHINIRYYFITARIASGEVSIEYCPTGDMVGDFHTKSLQGSQFCQFRDIILGIANKDIAGYNTQARQYRKAKKEKHLIAQRGASRSF